MNPFGLTDAQWGGGALLGAAIIAALASVIVAWVNRRTLRAVEGQVSVPSNKDAGMGTAAATIGELMRELYKQGLLTQSQLGELKARMEGMQDSVDRHHAGMGHAGTLALILQILEQEHGAEARKAAEQAIRELNHRGGEEWTQQ